MQTSGENKKTKRQKIAGVTGFLTDSFKTITGSLASFGKRQWIIFILIIAVVFGLIGTVIYPKLFPANSINITPTENAVPLKPKDTTPQKPKETAPQKPEQSGLPKPEELAPLCSEESQCASCDLPSIDQNDLMPDYTAPRFMLLRDAYKEIYHSDPDPFDLYALTYYNNRKIREGYTIYHAIDPSYLGVEKGWKIFSPPRSWIKRYKAFPLSILQLTQPDTESPIRISGSSILSPLSSKISSCFEKVTEVKSVYINLGNTESGLRDYCQSKVDLFGANIEIDSKMLNENGCVDVELEKFEVARYAIVIIVNRKNPILDDLYKNSLNTKDMAMLLSSADLWKNVRDYWHDSTITRYYPALASSNFEVVKNKFFTNAKEPLTIKSEKTIDDEISLMDKVSSDENSIGIVSYSSYQQYGNIDKLAVVPIDSISPNAETLSGEHPKYPLAFTLYLYTGKVTYSNNINLQSFIDYYLAYEIGFIDKLDKFGYLYPGSNGYLKNLDAPP
jgi:ABC-type phosphate transport system substrate-binding protein